MADDSQPEDTNPLAPSVGRVLRKLVFTLGALFVAWLLLSQVAARFMFPGPPPPTPAPPPPQAEHMPPSPPPPPPGMGETAPLNERIDRLEAKIKVLEETLLATQQAPQSSFVNAQASAADKEMVGRLEQAITAQETELKSMRDKMADMERHSSESLSAFNAFTQLKSAAQHGEPFVLAQRRLEQIYDGDTEILLLLDEVAPFAETGAPTLTSLQSHFQGDINQVFAAGTAKHSFTQAFTSLIRVRKVGAKQAGGDDESVIARTEAQLSEGNVSNALQELAALSPQASDMMAGWVAEAQAYVMLQQALGELELSLSGNKTKQPEKPQPQPEPEPAAEEE